MTDETMTVLDELLDDPMVRMVMERDGVRPEDFRVALERDRRRADGQTMLPPAHVIAACQANNPCY